MPTCDIIMPIYNAAPVLPFTLTALFSQKIPPTWRVQLIASDDASTDDSLKVIASHAQGSGLPAIVLPGRTQAGPAHARNRALEKSQADLVFFLGADIILRPGALAEHLNFHAHHPEKTQAALGFIIWDPRLYPSPLQEWMTHGGPQNDFDSLLGQTFANPQHYFYAAQLSLKRSILPKPAFNPMFTQYGWEDLALGRYLSQKHLKLCLLHQARALHRHAYPVLAIKRRQLAVGRGLRLYQKQFSHEQLLHVGSRKKQIIRRLLLITGGLYLLELLTRLALRYNRSIPWLFFYFTSLAFWSGWYRGSTKRVKDMNRPPLVIH